MSVINAVPEHDARKVSFLIRVRLQFADTAYTISVHNQRSLQIKPRAMYPDAGPVHY